MLFFATQDGTTEISKGWIIAITVIVLSAVVGFYVLRSIAIYKLAKKYDVKCAVLAWFPFTWIYVTAKLLGDVALFGKKFTRFALTVFIVYSVAQAFYLTINALEYAPVIGFYLQGGNVYISTSSKYIEFCNYRVGASIGYIGCADMITPYSEGFVSALKVLVYVASLFNIVSLVMEVLVYSNFFRSFLPNHYFIATIFSIFGFFGPFAFAVRNNDKINYAEYMRARYAAFYGANRGGFGGGYGQDGQNRNSSDEPFDNIDGENNDDKKSDDPFDEFDDKK